MLASAFKSHCIKDWSSFKKSIRACVEHVFDKLGSWWNCSTMTYDPKHHQKEGCRTSLGFHYNLQNEERAGQVCQRVSRGMRSLVSVQGRCIRGCRGARAASCLCTRTPPFPRQGLAHHYRSTFVLSPGRRYSKQCALSLDTVNKTGPAGNSSELYTVCIGPTVCNSTCILNKINYKKKLKCLTCSAVEQS